MRESQVLLINIVPTPFFFNREQLLASDHIHVQLVMLQLAKKKNGLLKTLTIDMGPRTLERDPKTGSQLWRTREFMLELQLLVNDLVKPPFNKDEFGFAKPVYRGTVRFLPPIHFLTNKKGEVLDRWSSYKNKLTVEDIIKRVNKVAPKLKGG
jgi:hypothetical protein